MDSKSAAEFLMDNIIGEEFLQNFMKERFDRGKSILNPMTAFSGNIKAVTVKMKDQLIQVKEEHKQISRFLIV